MSSRPATAPVRPPEPFAAVEELVAPVRSAPSAVSADWDDLGDLGSAGESGIPQAEAAPAADAAPTGESAPAPLSWSLSPEPLALKPSEPAPASARAPAEEPPAWQTTDAVIDAEVRGSGWCAQCGALLSASDIFCGECGFVRTPTARPNDTVALDPFPWGSSLGTVTERVASRVAPEPVQDASAAGVPPAPSPVPAPPEPEPEPEPLDDDTRLVAPGARGDRFVLQFSTGESVTVTGAGLLGRNPMPEPGEYFDALVTISDPGKSVSKTHLEFGQECGAFWVSDRYSGNGTIVREPDRPGRRCDPGKRYRIARGTRVDIGEQFFVVS